MPSDSGEPPAGARFVIHGRVQGVGFRWWTLDRARELGLTGTVRNLPDGTVEVVAFGLLPALDQLRRSLPEGPPAAQVTRVQESTPTLSAAPRSFDIEH